MDGLLSNETIQYGFAGICVILIAVLVFFGVAGLKLIKCWMKQREVDSKAWADAMAKNQQVIDRNTAVVQDVHRSIGELTHMSRANRETLIGLRHGREFGGGT